MIHLLKDPAHKGNLRAIRKHDLNDPQGGIRAHTAYPSGEEEQVALCSLSGSDTRATLESLYTRAYAPRKAKTRRTDEIYYRFLASEDPQHSEKYGKTFFYRRKKIAELLVGLAEELAKNAGYSEIVGEFKKGTAAELVKKKWLD